MEIRTNAQFRSCDSSHRQQDFINKIKGFCPRGKREGTCFRKPSTFGFTLFGEEGDRKLPPRRRSSPFFSHHTSTHSSAFLRVELKKKTIKTSQDTQQHSGQDRCTELLVGSSRTSSEGTFHPRLLHHQNSLRKRRKSSIPGDREKEWSHPMSGDK